MTSLAPNKNVLIIKSSPAANSSVSNEIADYLVSQLGNKHESYDFLIRDLAKTPAPQIDGPVLEAFFTAPDQLTDEQQALVEPSLELIGELKAADIIVFASAMHNFSISALLKAYIDQICRFGLTFQYGENGPEGLLNGKKAVVISSAGGDFQQEHAKAMDFQTPYLQRILNFIGIEDISVVPVQGMQLDPENADKIKSDAKAKVQHLAVSEL